MKKIEYIAYFLAFVLVTGAQSAELLVEAESFEDYGGWKLDQQFMDQMGSPYLLAHGLGHPVADAETSVNFPSTGTYNVWVRNFDWVSPWKTPQTAPAKRAIGTPGMFKILINNKALDPVFGTTGSSWLWQPAGQVRIAEKTVALKLHDMTGFEGRCDAIYFSTNSSAMPPNENPQMTQWRRKLLNLPEKPLDAGHFDLVVVGGGLAGMTATLQGARLGLKVVLLHDRPVPGGNNSSEVRVWLNGNTNKEPWPGVGDITYEFEPAKRAHVGDDNTADIYEDEKRIAILSSEKNVTLAFNTRANAVETEDNLIRAVIGQDIRTGERRRYTGRWFADCTGDGCVGYLAGADYSMLLEGHMGRSNLWNIKDSGSPKSFPRCPWALDLSDKPFPSDRHQLGAWFWESGFFHDPFEKNEYIRDWNFRAMYGAWDAMKNVQNKFVNYQLNWAAYITGRRESRQLLGDIILTKDDFINSVKYEDGCVPTTWHIDLHLPDPAYEAGFEGDAFISEAHFTTYTKPYWIPYRCLYSRNIGNLFMAGRDISVTHEGLGPTRVMRTGGMMGEIVAMASSLCKKHNTTPRGVYQDYLPELFKLMSREVTTNWLKSVGPSLTPQAKIDISSCFKTDAYFPRQINDGQADTNNNAERWLSSASVNPDWITFSWDQPRYVSAWRIVSGYYLSGDLSSAIQDFVLQYKDGNDWKDVPGSQVFGNRRVFRAGTFTPVRSNQFRLLITKTPGNIARIWEVELFHPTADLDKNSLVNNADLDIMVDSWLAAANISSADFSRNHMVNLIDYDVLSQFWQWGL